MTYAERLARLVYRLLCLSLVLGGGWWAVRATRPVVVDARTGTPGIAVEVDAGSGCQYVVTPWGGIFARLDADGKPMCKTAAR